MRSEDDNNIAVLYVYKIYSAKRTRSGKTSTHEICTCTKNHKTHPLILWKSLSEEHQHKQDVTARQQNGEHGRCAVEITGHEISRLAREICTNQRPDEKSDRKRNSDRSLKHKAETLRTYVHVSQQKIQVFVKKQTQN